MYRWRCTLAYNNNKKSVQDARCAARTSLTIVSEYYAQKSIKTFIRRKLLCVVTFGCGSRSFKRTRSTHSRVSIFRTICLDMDFSHSLNLLYLCVNIYTNRIDVRLAYTNRTHRPKYISRRGAHSQLRLGRL